MKKFLSAFLVLWAFASSAQLPSYLPSNGLVAWYPFNGNANDESGNGNNGTVNGCVGVNDRLGNINSAFEFGNLKSVSVPMNLQLFQLPNRTFSCWFRANGTQSGGRIYETTFRNGGIGFISNTFDTWYGYSQHCCNISGINSGSFNAWHHLVSIANDNTGLTQVYLDGSLVATSNGYPAGNGCGSNTAWQWQGEFIRFGLGASNESFDGAIDDIAIYNRALTQSEITSLYVANSCDANIINNDTAICAGNSVTLSIGNRFAGKSLCNKSELPVNLQNGLVGFYPFCGNANDQSGNNNNGTNTGATLTSNRYGEINNAYFFNGTNNYIDLPAVFNSPSFTLSVWGNSDLASSFCSPCHVLFSKISNPNPNNNFELRGPNEFIYGDGTGNGSNYNLLLFNSNNLTLGSWYHVVVSYDATLKKASIYLNGVLSNTVTGGGLTNLINQAAAIGARPGTHELPFYGKIDDVFFYNRVISNSEVLQLYNLGSTISWSTGASSPSITVTPTQTTTYYVTVSNGISSCTDSVRVIVNSVPRNFFSQDTIKACGTAYTLDAGTGSVYSWSTGETTRTKSVTTTGWYKCTVTNAAGCVGTDSVFLSLVNANIVNNDTTVCGASAINLNIATNSNGNVLGCSWQLVSSGDCYKLVAGPSGKLFIPRRTDMLRSFDNGNTWNNANWTLGIVRSGTSLQTGSVYNFVTNQLIQCALDNGYWVSNNDGNSFTQTGPTGFGTGGVEMLQLNNGRVLASMGGFQRGVYKSNDINNNTWSNKYAGTDSYDFVSFGDSIIFSGTSNNLLKSTNQGDSWASLFPDNISDVEKINDSLFWINSSGNVYVSNIQNINASISPRSNIGSGYFDAKYDLNSRLLVVTKNTGGIFISKDNGFSWSSCLINGATNYNDVTIYQNKVYVGTNIGLYSSSIDNNVYRWSTGATTLSITVAPAQSTTYYLTASNSISSCTDSVRIIVNSVPSNFFAQDTIKACGTAYTLDAGTGSVYSWSTGETTRTKSVTTTGWYKCTVTNTSGCVGTDSVFVSLVNANIVNNDTTICNGQIVTFNVSTINPTGVLDYNNNSYPIIKIGAQNWTQKNLNISRYRNGDLIPQVSDAAQWYSLTTGAWCWYNNDSATYAATYGKLYNWYAVNAARGFAPGGWHIPSNSDWNTLVKYLDPNADTLCVNCIQSPVAGNYLKEAGTAHWNSPNTNATNSSGFTALPGGYRDNTGFRNITNESYWWSSYDGNTNNNANYRLISYLSGEFIKYNNTQVRIAGLSARLIQDTYSYRWSTGDTTATINVSPTVSTTYYVTVSNGISSCKDSVRVTVNPVPNNFFSQDTIKACGTAYTLDAGTGSIYSWSTGETTRTKSVTTTGWYKCTVTNAAGCVGTDSVFVSLVNANIVNNDTAVCQGSSIILTASTGTSATSATQLPANLRNGLVGYWPFNGNANDESGNGNNGTVNGATLTTDRFGNAGRAYFFNHFDEISTNLNSISGSQPRSISFWLKNQNSNRTITPIWYGGSSNAYPGYVFNIKMNRNEQHDPCGCWPTTYEGAGIDGAWMNLIYRTVIGDNRWHNYVYVVDGSNSSFNQIKIYKDGLLISSLANISFDYNNNSSTIINTANAVPLKFGRSMANQGVATDLLDRAPTEFLDDIAIYNRALSPLEVQQLSIPITYRWSTGDTTATINVSPTVTTTYYLTVSNGISSCTDSVRVTVNPVNRNFFAQDTIKACGTSYTLNAGTGTSYLWNTGATARTLAVTNSGWYKCRVTTGVCTETDSVFVSITRANILNNDTTINRSLNLTLQVDTLAGVTPRPQFRWSTGATTTSISVFPLVTTTYYCTVSNGISTCTDSVKITVNDKFNLSAPTLKICGPQDISAATTVDVPITVKVFNSIVGFQGSIKWDSTVLKYQSTFNYAPGLGLSSGNFNNASANTLLYSWLDVNLTGQTLPDSSVLFTIRYNIVPGAWGKSTAIQFANTPNALEAIQEPAKNLIVLTQSGLVSIGARPVLDTLRISGCGNVVYLGTNYTSSVNVSTTLRNTSGCDSIYRTAIISVTPIPVISAVTANSPLFIGDNLQFNVAGQNLTGATYSWTGPNSFTSSAQNPTLTATAASSGQYRLIFIQACKRDTQYVSVTVNAGISGRIITPLRQPVSRVSLLQNNQSSLINGSYALAVNPSLPLVLKASKNNDINKSNGVSAIDIVLIQNHILQRSLLGDPYKLIAADVNKSGTISTLDLLYIKRMILGLDTTYPGNNLWSFVDSSYVFPNPANPFPYKDSFSYNAASLQSNKTNQTFLGIKLGDVNYDWDVNQARPAPSDNIELFHEDVWVKEGNEIHIPVRVRNFKELLGLQFTLNFNHQKLRFNRVEKNPIQLRFATNRLESGKMSFVWTEDYNVPTTLLNDALLMELVFDKVADFSEEELTLSADVASIEAWDKHFTKHFITKGSGKIKRLPDSPVWSVRPNPTKGNVFIHFVVRDKQKVHAELTDNLGRIVFQQENDLPAGIVEWRVDLQQNGMLPPGIYYLRIPEIDKQIKKLVIIK